MKKIIVLVAHGREDEPPHSIGVRIFDYTDDAVDYIESVDNPIGKFWTKASIVDDGVAVIPTNEAFVPACEQMYMKQ